MANYDSPRLHSDVVSALRVSANEADYSSGAAFLGEHFTNVRLLHATENVPNRPNTSLWQTKQAMIVLSGGVRTDSMYPLVIDGWSDAEKIALSRGYNHFAYTIALEQLLSVKFPELAGKPSWVMVGTSLGSMVCHAFNEQNRMRGQKDADAIITVGSPRSLASGYEGRYGQGEQYRFMNIGDPVCSFPPRFSEAPLLVTAASGLQGPWDRLLYLTISGDAHAPAPIRLWPRFYHTEGGICITPEGEAWEQEGPVPNALLGTIAPGVLEAYIGAEQFHDHATLMYDTNLRRRYKLGALQFPLEVAGGEWGLAPGFDVDPSFILPVDIAGNFQPSFTGGFFPMPASPIGTDTMPGKNGGRLGVLTLNGEIVAIYENRGYAKTAARYLRKFLARLPAANSVSLSGLQTGLGNYLAAASRGRGVTKKSVVVGS